MVVGGMLMIGWLNVASFALGLVSWFLPLYLLIQLNKVTEKDRVKWVVTSLSACILAIYFQLYTTYHLVKLEDWTALLDTTWFVVFAATVLFGVTISLNLFVMKVVRRS